MSNPWLTMPFSEAVEINPRRPVARGTLAPFVDMAGLPAETPKVRTHRVRLVGGGGSRFTNGDTLFARITPCTENGKTGLVDCFPTGEIATGSTEFIVLGPTSKSYSSPIHLLLGQNPTFRSFAISRMRGTSGRQRVPANVFDDFEVGIPPLREQRKIAAILASVDDAVEKTQAVIDQVQVVKRGLMQELLTRGLPGRHTRFKQTQIGEVPEGWIQTNLGGVLELKRGYDLPRRDRTVGTVPLISSSGATDTHGEARVKGPGVVTGRYGNIGQVFFVSDDFWPLNTTLYVCDFKDNDPRFISHFLRGLDFAAHSGKTAVPGVNRNHLHRTTVVFPPDVGEQRTIATILSSVDDAIEKARSLIGSAHVLKSALMSVLLTGELRVTPDP